MEKERNLSVKRFSPKAIFLLLIFIFTFAAPSSALADPASFFDTNLAQGKSRFKQVVNDAAGGTAVFFEIDLSTSTNNVFSVTGDDGTSVAWVRASRMQNGTRIPATDNLPFFNSPRDSTGYYNYWGVSVSSWNEVLQEGVKFEFFEDAALATEMEVNAFGTHTYHWGTCCYAQNNYTPTGVSFGTAIYAGYAGGTGGTHVELLLGNITSYVSPDTHFIAQVDDRDATFTEVTIAPNGHGEAFGMGGYVIFSVVGEDSVPPGSGSTPSIPPGNPDLTAATDLGISNTDNLTSETSPDFSVTYTPQNDIDFVNLYSGTSSSGPWTLIATSPAAGTTSETTVVLTSTTLTEGNYYIVARVENGYWHDESDPNPSPLFVRIDSTPPTMTITAAEVSDGDTSNDPTLSLTFTSSESTTSFSAGDVVVTNGSIGALSGSGSTYTATLTPAADGPVTVNVPVSSYIDNAGNDNLAAVEFNWISDQTPPTVTFNPLDGSTIVANAADLILTLSEPIRRASDNADLTDLNIDDQITLRFDNASGTIIPFDATIDVNNQVITIDPVSDLPSNRQVFVAIGSSVEDVAENPLADASATFMSADEDQPTLSSSSPTDGQVGVDINADLVLYFSEAVDAESGNIEIRRTSDGTLFESISVIGGQVSGSGTATITVGITGPLSSLTGYYVLIDSTAFDDADSNSYGGIADPRTLDFETEFIDISPPVLTFNPLDGSTGISETSNITLTFDEAIRNLDNSALNNANVDSLITLKDTNASGANILFDATIDGANQIITINPTSNFSSEQVVYVAIGATVEDVVDNAFGGDNASFTVADFLAPILQSTTPVDGSSTVAPDDNLTLVFNEPVYVQFGTIKIYNASDDSIFESISVTSPSQISGSGTNTIVVTHANDFAYGTDYYVRIDATAFDDASGNSYAGIADTTSWNFTTLTQSGTITCSPVSITTNENTSDTVTANCSVSGLSYSVTQPLLGLSSNLSGTLTFNPAGDYEFLGQGESDTTNGDFTYTANDGTAVSAPANVEVTVTGLNDPPTANDDSVSTNEDTSFTTGNLVAANDVDPDTSDSLTVISMDSTGTTGIVTNNGNGTFTYNPNGLFETLAAGESTTDNFTYTIQDGFGQQDTATVTVTISGVNDNPTARDDSASTDEDTSFRTGNLVAANDSDPDTSDTLTVVGLNSTATNGNVFNNGNGTFDYYPNGQYDSLDLGDTSIDTFTYTISDGHGGSDTALVTITINGINDAPSITSCDIGPTPSYTDSTLIASVTGWNDPEGDLENVNYEWYLNSVLLSAHSGNSTLPSSVFVAGDSIDLECTPIDTAPLSGTTLTDSISISNSDPVIQPDFESTPEDTAITVDVLDNDSDQDAGDTLSITGVTQGAHGTVTNNGTDLTYLPDPNWNGIDTFDYTVEDGSGGSGTGSVTITVNAAEDLTVMGNGVSIPNGDITPSTTDHTDFGSTALFLGTVQHTFTIENLGNIDLALNGSPRVDILGANAADFTVTSQPSSPLGSGATTPFIIEFDPSAPGLRSASVSIATDDTPTPFEFDIQGTGNVQDVDNDGMSDTLEQNGDRDSDGVPDYQDYDPSGYFYDEATGEIISGGLVSASGPGVVTMIQSGSGGFYQFVTDGTAGIYTITVNLPPGFGWSLTCLRGDPPPYDPTGQPDPDSLGAGENGTTGFLTSSACTSFYMTLDLDVGDPFIINNNFPLYRLPLPDTGFTPGVQTSLPQQTPENSYQLMNGLWLEIPSLDVRSSLVGVPAVNGSWDVTWLGRQAGFLVGTAYPTWSGNTVITGHVWNADNTPGIFVDLKSLNYGDTIQVHSGDSIFSYQVTVNRRVSPLAPKAVLEHKDADWITLFTCESFGEFWGDYGYRRMVQAVLVDVSLK